MKCIGKVKSGLGEGSSWMNMAKKVFKEKYNMDVFLGTLNIELEQELIIKENEIVEPHEYGGNLKLFIAECIVKGHKSYIIRTERNNKARRGPPTKYNRSCVKCEF